MSPCGLHYTFCAAAPGLRPPDEGQRTCVLALESTKLFLKVVGQLQSTNCSSSGFGPEFSVRRSRLVWAF